MGGGVKVQLLWIQSPLFGTVWELYFFGFSTAITQTENKSSPYDRAIYHMRRIP